MSEEGADRESDALFDSESQADPALDSLLRKAARQSLGARPPLVAGTKLDGGRFEIRRRVGQGGMGVVYEAFDSTRREAVALKTVSRMEAGDVYWLKNEFRALAEVSHPNLVRLHELSVDGALWFFTMDLVAGERFDRWVRPRADSEDRIGTLDEARLRATLPQLVDAIAAIHAAGKLHRDLKPSNVLVTAEGRVVVLDFGLAIDPDLGGVGQTVADGAVSGTPAYMAPEQAAGRAATAASDFYALGMMVFEALTGRLPFSGSAHEILVAKQRSEARPARSFAPDAPADLDALCAQLLAREPGARPDGAALLAQFPVDHDASWSSSSRGSFGRSAPGDGGPSRAGEDALELLGRDAELAVLREAFEATLSDRPVIVMVRGESGMGKSALCEALLQELHREGRATVLAGRCYERENVPFKGFDSLVDDLSRHLRKLSREEAIAVLPREVHALTRLFPVLGRVEVVASAPHKEIPDPLELRRRAYAAFGELLMRMRDRAPLCVHLDDVQWLDADAVLFMSALMVHPEPVPLLLLLSHRSEGADDNQALLSIRHAIEGNSRLSLRELPVGTLSHAAARDLALRMLPEDDDSVAPAADAVARESAGSPFFVGELCRFVVRHGMDEGALARLSLTAALADHLGALKPAARRLLEHTALAGKPLPLELLLQAAEASHGELDVLRGSHLVRLSSLEGGRVVECYHDRVRETVVGALSELQRVGCFAALAGALEARAHPDPELLAVCFEGAGQHAAAAEHYARAAEQALTGTAFMQAAELYDRALSLGIFPSERARELGVAHGDALAHAGLGKQAAQVFLRVAGEAQGAQRSRLRRRAATELFNTGHVEEGMALFRELFTEHGLTMPSGPGSALRRLLLSQLRLRLRGLGYAAREAADCPPQRLEALALLDSALQGLGTHAPLIAAAVADEYVLQALDLGEPEWVALALTCAGTIGAGSQPAGSWPGRLLDAGQGIASHRGGAALRARVEWGSGLRNLNSGRWQAGREDMARALDILQHQPRGVAWEIDFSHVNAQMVAFMAGDWRWIASVTPGRIEQCYSRERISSAVMLSGGLGSVAWLCGDDTAGFRRTLERARARWQAGPDALLPDFSVVFGEVALRLYRGEAAAAFEAVEGSWRWLARSVVARAQFASLVALHYRGIAALAVLRASGERDALPVVRDSAKRLRKFDLPYGKSHRSLLEAGLALHAGERERGASQLRAAVDGFERYEMPMYAAAARRRLGELLGGDEGAALLAEGDARMRAQRVVDLDAMTELLCAGCRAP